MTNMERFLEQRKDAEFPLNPLEKTKNYYLRYGRFLVFNTLFHRSSLLNENMIYLLVGMQKAVDEIISFYIDNGVN